MIEQRIIDQVIDTADIVEVAGRYTELRRRGANWEGCCPFHKERTPSFKVSAAKGIWTCFGACQESGNVISLVMRAEGLTFPEAVRKLAAELHITIDDHQPTAEEIKARHRRESLLAVVAHAAAWFRQQMGASPQGLAARAYAVRRWGEETVVRRGIGYAPASWTAFVDWALDKGLDASLMEEAGLVAPRKTGGYYAVFRDRLVIPIADRAGQVIGFTARYMGSEDDQPKYINSRESDIYHKGDSIFGIDWAKRTATRAGKFYLVEGGPDVLKMQAVGIDNTVASLGTAWTDKQLALLKRMAPAVCFIPDADPPKEGKPYGTGIEKVMKNGRAALAAGLSVSVIEIPLGEGCTKADPDTWFTSRGKMEEADEQDFIPWFAAKSLLTATGTDGQSAVVKEVARMVAATGDEVREKMYIAALGKVMQGRSLWAQAVAAAKKELAEQDESGGSLSRRELMRYGFYESHGGYCAMTEKGEVQWSNFTMTPLFHIKDPITSKRLFVARNYEGREAFIEVKQADMVNLAAFQTVMESAGNFIWMAGAKEMIKLKGYLYEKTATAEEVQQFGWNPGGFYVFGNGILQDGKFHEGDDYGIVHLDGDGGNWYIPALSKLYAKDKGLFTFERQFVAVKTQELGLADYFAQVCRVYGDTGRVALAWLVATCFRDIIVRKTRFFPLLDVFEPKGTGKSELALAMMAIFQTRTTLTFLTNSSRPALAETVAQVANAPVHLEEYKNSIGFEKIEFLKGIWDGQGRSRMNMDRDKRKETSKVDSGVVITGQEIPTADIALFSRVVFLMLNKTSFSNSERAEFERLRRMKERGVTHLSLELLAWRPVMEQEFVAAYNEVCADFYESFKKDRVEDRIINNWAVVAAAAKVLDGQRVLPYSYVELRDIARHGIMEQNKFCLQNNDTANFWGIVAYLQQDGYIYNESDYKIKVVTSLTVEGRTINFDDPREILMLRKNRVIALYRKYGAQVGDNILPTPTIESYLKYSAEFLGRKKSERFKLIQQGREMTQKVEQIGGASFKTATTVDQALCFDYAAIVTNYGINLRVETDDGGE